MSPSRATVLRAIACLALLGLLADAPPAQAARLRDLVDIEGVRDNPLVGLGLVVGLAGTGDDASSVLGRRELALMAGRLGVTIAPTDIKSKNVAAVVVTASIPAFARPGSRLDVTVSSLGTAKSLAGGTLIMTPLRGANLRTYALAQGALLTGGFSESGGSGSSSKKNHTTVGRIPGGAVIERGVPSDLPDDEIVLLLREPDFATAARIGGAVVGLLGPDAARVRDPGAVVVTIDGNWHGRVVELVATLEQVEVEADTPARVIIDERTGTLVVGADVTLGPAAIAYGDLRVDIKEDTAVSQPAPLGGGGTVAAPSSTVQVTETPGELHLVAGAATVGDVVAALAALGLGPRDLIPVLEALRAAGSLHAEIRSQ